MGLLSSLKKATQRIISRDPRTLLSYNSTASNKEALKKLLRSSTPLQSDCADAVLRCGFKDDPLVRAFVREYAVRCHSARDAVVKVVSVLMDRHDSSSQEFALRLAVACGLVVPRIIPLSDAALLYWCLLHGRRRPLLELLKSSDPWLIEQVLEALLENEHRFLKKKEARALESVLPPNDRKSENYQCDVIGNNEQYKRQETNLEAGREGEVAERRNEPLFDPNVLLERFNKRKLIVALILRYALLINVEVDALRLKGLWNSFDDALCLLSLRLSLRQGEERDEIVPRVLALVNRSDTTDVLVLTFLIGESLFDASIAKRVSPLTTDGSLLKQLKERYAQLLEPKSVDKVFKRYEEALSMDLNRLSSIKTRNH